MSIVMARSLYVCLSVSLSIMVGQWVAVLTFFGCSLVKLGEMITLIKSFVVLVTRIRSTIIWWYEVSNSEIMNKLSTVYGFLQIFSNVAGVLIR